jgi:hypothetical protein
MLNGTLDNASAFLCPYEEGFGVMDSYSCCPKELVQLSWEVAQATLACARHQMSPHGDPWLLEESCGVPILSNKSGRMCYRNNRFGPC